MSFLLVDQAEEIVARYLVNHSPSAAEDLVLRLFRNKKTPADGDTEADYTEATFTGYAHVDLSGIGWTITPDAPTLLQYAQQEFVSSADQAAQTIYGYYLTQVSSGKLVCAWRFDDGPYSVSKNLDKVKVTPKIQIKKPSEVA